MPTSIMDAIRQFLNTYPGINDLINPDLGIRVDWLDGSPQDIGIFAGGDDTLTVYMNKDRIMQKSFYIQFIVFGPNDLERLNNSGVVEGLQEWLYQKNYSGGFELPEKCSFDSVEIGDGVPIDSSEDGQEIIYRINGNLIYEKEL